MSNFFWNSTKELEVPKKQQQPLVEKKSEDDALNPSNWDSLGFLMEQFKEERKSSKRKPLLPPQDPKYEGKMTVVIEMDEILFYTFVPDEHEAYINAPLK